MKPLVLPHGGYGLGNELLPLGKAYLIAKECHGKLLDISWRDNKRDYNKYFKTPWFDPLLRRFLWRTIPRISFPVTLSSHDLRAQIKTFCHTHNLYKRSSPCLVTVTGIDGGPETVLHAKDYLFKRLLNTSFTLDNLLLINSVLDSNKLIIGVHIRLGDFYEIGSRSYAGVVNTRLPVNWYTKVILDLYKRLGRNNVQVVLATDSPLSSEIREIERITDCFVISRIPNSDVSDLLALAKSDLLICSSSTYSMWAASLGNPYYIWYEPNLLEISRGFCLNLAQLRSDLAEEFAGRKSPTNIASHHLYPKTILSCLDTSTYRGYPVSDSGHIPEDLSNALTRRFAERHSSRDLVRGGVFSSIPPE
ncbi:alpha-1,2-fucosyltransferase [Synechococcus sp. AH-736-G20]|nr:alpha-1,2-fucosyltransferase [Synechococcus sp. AH-736-G20]